MPHLRWWTIRLLTRPSQLLIATFVRDLSFNLPTKWQFSNACLFSTFPSFPITSTLKLGLKSLLFRFKWRWKSFPKADTLYCISSSCALPTARRMRILGKESSCDTKVPSSSTWIGCTTLYSGTEKKNVRTYDSKFWFNPKSSHWLLFCHNHQLTPWRKSINCRTHISALELYRG